MKLIWKIILLIGCGVSSSLAQPAPEILLDRAEVAGEVAKAANHGWLRSRPVRVNRAALEDLRAGKTDRFAFTSFGGERVSVKLTERESAGSQGLSWSGIVEGDPASTVQLVSIHDSVSLVLNFSDRPPHALRLVDGEYRLCEVGVDGSCAVVSQRGPKALATPSAPKVGSTEWKYIDIIILYTPAARAAAGGQQQVEAECFAAINGANVSHARSATYTRLRLVHLAEVAYTEVGNITDDVNRLRGMNDGHLDFVHSLRTNYGADLMSLLVNYSSGDNGIGEIGGAFSAVKWSTAASALTFAHETGHNFGCGHRVGDGDGLFPYSHGYIVPSFPQVRTVMASDPTGGFIPRIPHYSNPDVTFTVGGIAHATGTADTADNARTIRERKHTTADYVSPTNAFYTFAQCSTCPPNELPAGDASPFGPARRLAYMFDGGSFQSGVGMLTSIGLPANVPANIYMDSSVNYPEAIRITRPSRLQHWAGHGNGPVRIGP